MFNKPEEVIMAILTALFVVLTYFIAGYTGASVSYIFMITGFTAIWGLASFLLWQAGRIDKLYPLVLGALVACWWPWLDWFAVRGVVATGGEVLMVEKPWYATWWFKIVLAMLPVVVGYFRIWRKSQKPKF